MKSCPFAGRIDGLAKTIGHGLDQFAKALADNGGAIPDGWHGVAEGLAQDLARQWAAGNGNLFKTLAKLCERRKKAGTPPGQWEHITTFYVQKVLLARPSRHVEETPEGRVVTIHQIDLGATVQDVIQAAARDGVELAPLDVKRAFRDVRLACGFTTPKQRAGRRKGSKTSPESKLNAKLRKGRQGKGDAGLSAKEMPRSLKCDF